MRPRPWTVVAATVLVACLVVVGVGQWWLHVQRSEDHRDATIRDAARTTVTAVLSYDYRRLRAGMHDTTPLLTGAARTDYLGVQKPLLTTAPKIKAVLQATVRSLSVLSADDRSARVLLFVDQVSTSTKLSQPQLDQSRVVVDLTRHDDHWLVSTLKAI